MKYSVEGDGAKVKIRVVEVGSRQTELMKELNECAEGRCSCPMDQYAEVESMQITPGKDQLSLTLKAKPGEKIDQGDINNWKLCSGVHAGSELGAPVPDVTSRGLDVQ